MGGDQRLETLGSSSGVQTWVRRERGSRGSEQRSENPGGFGGQGPSTKRSGLGWGVQRQGPAPALRVPLLPLIQEELEFCEKLLQTCFSSPTDDSMDR